MPTYERMQFLPAAVESIFAQTLRDWELVVVDDGSADGRTLEYLRALERDARVHVLRREHSGNPGRARNVGIAIARADFVAFMDSDDLWAPTKLERQLAEMRAEPTCGWSYSAFVNVDANDVPFPSEARRPWTPYGGEIFRQTVRGTASIRTPAVIARAELLREVGGFDERIECAEDYDLWVRLALRAPVCVVDEPLVRVRRHRPDSAGTPGASHAGREFSLRKLATALEGPRRTLLIEELGRNAWWHACVMAELVGRRQAVATFATAARFGWRYPRWWYGAGGAAACAFVGCVSRGPGSSAVAEHSTAIVETRVERPREELRAGDR
jgi:hypothetical protein